LALGADPAVLTSGVTNTSNEALSLTEVVVTAQKRTERLLSVPAPVTALQAQELDRNDSLRIQDFAATAPGLNWLSDRQGRTRSSCEGSALSCIGRLIA
jgi:iron complex outermembrane recepter protein